MSEFKKKSEVKQKKDAPTKIPKEQEGNTTSPLTQMMQQMGNQATLQLVSQNSETSGSKSFGSLVQMQVDKVEKLKEDDNPSPRIRKNQRKIKHMISDIEFESLKKTFNRIYKTTILDYWDRNAENLDIESIDDDVYYIKKLIKRESKHYYKFEEKIKRLEEKDPSGVPRAEKKFYKKRNMYLQDDISDRFER